MANRATADSLRIGLYAGSGGQSAVNVTVENTHPSEPLTLLKWDTPLDKSCFRTGVLSMTDIASGEPIPGPGLKINRLLPPAREDLVEIPAQGTVGEELMLNEPWMPADGRSVKIEAKGSWRAIWCKRKDRVTTEELEAMGGAEMMQGSFFGETEVKLKLHR